MKLTTALLIALIVIVSLAACQPQPVNPCPLHGGYMDNAGRVTVTPMQETDSTCTYIVTVQTANGAEDIWQTVTK